MSARMNKRPLLVLAGALVTCSGTTTLVRGGAENAAPCGPLRPVPSGWICIVRPAADSWVGAYFDSVSGALVRFHVGKSDPATSSGGVQFEGVSNGVPYRAVRFHSARQRALAFWMQQVGNDSELPPEVTEALPPESASELWVSFSHEKRRPTNFVVTICDSTQEDRARDMLFQKTTLNEGLSGTPSTSSVVTPALAAEIETRQLALSEVLRRAGTPMIVSPAACEGVGLTYEVCTAGNSCSRATFSFCKQGRLLRTRWQQGE